MSDNLSAAIFDGCYHDAPQGARFNTKRTRRELGTGATLASATTVQRYVTKGLRLWGGEVVKLAPPILMKNPLTGVEENTYAVADVDRIKAGRRSLEDMFRSGRHVDADGRPWLLVETALEILKELKCTKPTLIAYETRCPPLGAGNHLEAKNEQDEKGNWRKWYLEEQILLLRDSRLRIAEGVYGAPDDSYLIAAAVIREYGVAYDTLQSLVALGRVTVQWFPRKHGGSGGSRVKAYREADVRAYRRPGQGPPFDGVYYLPDGRVALNLLTAARQFNIALHLLQAWSPRARGNQRGKPILACHYLPEGYLPTETRERPGYGWKEKTVLEADMVRLQNAIRAAKRNGKKAEPDDGLRTAKEIAKHYGATGYRDYVRLGVLLYRLTESGQLGRRKTKRFRSRGWYKPWGYNLDQFDRLLAGRSLQEVLRDFKASLRNAGVAIRLVNGRFAAADLQEFSPVTGQASPPVIFSPSTEKKQQKPKMQRGRLRDPRTEEVEKFCYEAYTSGKKLASALAEGHRLFGVRAPKGKSHLRLYAQRYAIRYNLPLERPSNPQKTPEKQGGTKIEGGAQN